MQIFKNKEACNGCAACANVCPLKCIKMEYDDEGFLYPSIDSELCIDCGICNRTCKKTNDKRKFPLKSTYAVKHLEKSEQLKSSSGAFFPELAKKVLSNEGVVFGAAFDEKFNVIQREIIFLNELSYIRGSKYVQGNVEQTYLAVQEYLKQGKKVLYSGTPCQISGLHAFLNGENENLICASIMCHGTPSPQIWQQYLRELSNNKEIKTVEFRHKMNSQECWKNYFLKITYDNGIYLKESADDLYYKAFDSNLFLRPSCYNCRCKSDNQLADIVMGDYWGADELFKEFENEQYGISAVVINTEKGNELFDSVRDKFQVLDGDFEYLSQTNRISISERENPIRTIFYDKYRETGKLLSCLDYGLNFIDNFFIKYTEKLDQMPNEGNYVLWGTGNCFKKNVHLLKSYYRNVFVCDNDKDVWWKAVAEGIECISPDEVSKDAGVIIMIENKSVCYTIGQQLLDMGIDKFCTFEHWFRSYQNTLH